MLNKDEKGRIFKTMECGKKRYYVYALCTEDGPFYIGKGTADRVMQHLEAANLAENSIKSNDTLSKAMGAVRQRRNSRGEQGWH